MSDSLRALPLQVRQAARVCACDHIEYEHNLAGDNVRRTACGHGGCPCRKFLHTVDRYRVSTYVDAPADAEAPLLGLRRRDPMCDHTVDPTYLQERHGRSCRCGSL